MAANTVYVQGPYVDVHDNEVVNLSVDKAGKVQVDNGQTNLLGTATKMFLSRTAQRLAQVMY